MTFLDTIQAAFTGNNNTASPDLCKQALQWANDRRARKTIPSGFRPPSWLRHVRGRSLSGGLRRFLDTAVVTDRTDDDKSLIIATRARAGAAFQQKFKTLSGALSA